VTLLPTAAAPLSVCLQLTHAINRSDRFEDIYEAALDALESGLAVSKASILFFDPDGVMRFKAWRKLSEGYRRAVEGHTPWAPGAKGAEPIVVADVTENVELAPFLKTILAERIAAMAFIPLEDADGVIGKFMLYFPEPRDLSPEELQLASLIATQVAFAVSRSRARLTAQLSEARRMEALEASTRTSQQLAAIVESSDDAILSKDLNGIIASWNAGAERMFGYTASEAIGQSILIIIPPDRVDEVTMVLERIRAGQHVQMETVRRHKSGKDVPISLTVSPVKNAQGQIVGASMIARDITGRKQYEADLTEFSRRLSLLVSASASLLEAPETDAVRAATVSIARQLLVADGYAVWANDEDRHEWRIVKAEGVSEKFANRVIITQGDEDTSSQVPFSHPMAVSDVAAQPMVKEQLDAYRDEGIRSMLVVPMRIGPGRTGTLVFYYHTLRDFSQVDLQTGQALANLASAAMTTAALYEQQRVQSEAAESARRQAAFIADVAAVLSRSLDYEDTLTTVAKLAVPEIADWCAVDIVRPSGEVRRLAVAHVDPAKVEYARELQEKYAADPNATGGVHEVIRTEKPVLVKSISPELLARRVPDPERLRIVRALGLSSYICVPIVSPGGVLGAMTFVFAESGRHYGERDLSFAQDLASRAALAIDNAFAYQRAHTANRLKDEFLATLSHELRTPLNAILGYAQMLNLGALEGDAQSRAVTVLTRNADSLRQIIDDVLDVSRITSGKLRLAVRPVDLHDVLQNAVATMQPAADAKGVSLQLASAADVPSITGDPDRLQQVVWNLLSNAVKFTARGGHVWLSLEHGDGFVDVLVKDDGQGIDPKFVPHLFERFRQADSRFSREHGGLGLGLAIVRDLVELHGGSVTASSEGPGSGATFRVRMPVSKAARETGAIPHDTPRLGPKRVAGELTTRLKNARILAVDDQEDARDLLRVILESAGAEVTTASSAVEALELLRCSTYDGLIADLGMPQMDGLELIRRIRQTLPAPINELPAAALTAYARSDDRIGAVASGFQMHLAKPVNPTELVIAIGQLIGR
jgi:PAS domain S-box-containing protein